MTPTAFDPLWLGAVALGLLLFQLPFTAILLSRLVQGASRQPPISPRSSAPHQVNSVSVVVPTLNEAHRVTPCLQGLSQQGNEVREIIVVDSHSTDGTPEVVKDLSQQDSRIRLIEDDTLPPGWVGRPWALHSGYLASHTDSEWILGIDADTEPQPGLVGAVLHAAETHSYDVVSLSPKFRLSFPGEWWLQPALLMTLIYRFDSAGVDSSAAERVMANGQCFLCRRSVLVQLDGYSSAANSFCDDVTLARVAADKGFKVGFLDGAKVISVRMYEGAAETWQGWGRSLDLKDAATPAQLWGDLALLVATQALPIVVLFWLLFSRSFLAQIGQQNNPIVSLALGLNGFLLLVRLGMTVAIAGSYHRPKKLFSPAQFFWLSPLADPLAVLRIAISSFQTRILWRGKIYEK
ncbi:MAG: glycosyl transferase [Leptolyngbya foveolarum]|uniref:Glycosyl transferase n=1 Tax=Leptolyngbya foveolarum TaxID=47253 RepID=A0A2W4U296_9CYAN|nr:MAG: glycosyl transferase [Leptolyngbya foveolarum]